MRQLDAEDPAQAREPATAAAQELQLAAESMNRAGEEKARQQLEAGLRVMNQAADQARNAPNQPTAGKSREAAENVARQVEQTRRDLAEAARRQQESGSATAAAQMAGLANALNETKLRDQLKKLLEQSRNRTTAETTACQLDQLAQRMVPQVGPGGPTP